MNNIIENKIIKSLLLIMTKIGILIIQAIITLLVLFATFAVIGTIITLR